MSTNPVRIQLKRTKGWRIPENTVVVSRPQKWGNPWRLRLYTDQERRECVESFRAALLGGRLPFSVADVRRELAGKNLACWCPLTSNGQHVPCHGDVLLAGAAGETAKK